MSRPFPQPEIPPARPEKREQILSRPCPQPGTAPARPTADSTHRGGEGERAGVFGVRQIVAVESRHVRPTSLPTSTCLLSFTT